jgi:hypothetical protein
MRYKVELTLLARADYVDRIHFGRRDWPHIL